MFNSIAEIFEPYIGPLRRFDIHFIRVVPGNNPEDIFYLCGVKDKWYVVYESDYIGELSFVVKEVHAIFGSFEATHWLAKSNSGIRSPIPINGDTKTTREAIILKRAGTHLRYAVLEVVKV